MDSKKSQLTVIEVSLLIIFSSFFLLSLSYISQENVVPDYSFTVETFLDSIYYSGDFRSQVINEDLSVVGVTEDWSSLELLLNDSFLKYELIISNTTSSKSIYSCSADNTKIIRERIIAINNSEQYEFRLLRLGVCY